MRAAPSQTADAQAWRRARRRYPSEPDEDGFYVRGRREEDGTWTPVRCICFKCLEAQLPILKFRTVDAGMDHEFTALEERRGTWKNLALKQQSLAKHISAEQAATCEAMEEEGHLTRAALLKELKNVTGGLYIDIEGASSKKLQATILKLQSLKHDKVVEERNTMIKKKEEDRIKRTLEGKNGPEISAQAGELWRSVGPAEKRKYEELGAEDKIQYQDIKKLRQHRMDFDEDEKHGKTKKNDGNKRLREVPVPAQVAEPVLPQAQQEIVAQNRAQPVCRRQSHIMAQKTVLSKAQQKILDRAQASLDDGFIDDSKLHVSEDTWRRKMGDIFATVRCILVQNKKLKSVSGGCE